MLFAAGVTTPSPGALAELGARDRTQAVVTADRSGLVDPGPG
ncbi:hypothetical protein [Brachybacterium sp. SGAir0954]|nr:hypothetical protein [Brachybacterium sp. SGAir0954]